MILSNSAVYEAGALKASSHKPLFSTAETDFFAVLLDFMAKKAYNKYVYAHDFFA